MQASLNIPGIQGYMQEINIPDTSRQSKAIVIYNKYHRSAHNDADRRVPVPSVSAKR